MPPVPVFIDEPITPKKPQGITPQTAGSSSADAANTPSTTTAQAPYPAARPGQGVPAPTPYAPAPQALSQPTRTTTTAANDNAPPPPQPGAVPVAPSHQQAAPTATTSTLPPPPMAGQSTTTMPPQMSIPPPKQNYAPVYGTSSAPPTTTTPQRPGPTTLNFGAAPAPQTQAGSHPPGYQQNVMAQEMSSAARASLDQQEEQRRPSMVPNLNLGGDSANDTAGNVWNAVKGWASAAGNTLAETEKEVWKRINRDS